MVEWSFLRQQWQPKPAQNPAMLIETVTNKYYTVIMALYYVIMLCSINACYLYVSDKESTLNQSPWFRLAYLEMGQFFSIIVHSKKILKFHCILTKVGSYTKWTVKKSVNYHERCCIITAAAALPTLGHNLFIISLIDTRNGKPSTHSPQSHIFIALTSLLCEISQFEIFYVF